MPRSQPNLEQRAAILHAAEFLSHPVSISRLLEIPVAAVQSVLYNRYGARPNQDRGYTLLDELERGRYLLKRGLVP